MVGHSLAPQVRQFLPLKGSVFVCKPPPLAPRPRSYVSRTLLHTGACLCTQQAIVERAKARLLTEENEETDTSCSSSDPVSLPMSAENTTGVTGAATPGTQSRPKIAACPSPMNITGSTESSEPQRPSSGLGGEKTGEQRHPTTNTVTSTTTTHSGTAGEIADAMARNCRNEHDNTDGFFPADTREAEFDLTSATTRSEQAAGAAVARSRASSTIERGVSSSANTKASDRMEVIDNVTPSVSDGDELTRSIGDKISEATRISPTNLKTTVGHATIKMENVKGVAKVEVTRWVDEAMLSVVSTITNIAGSDVMTRDIHDDATSEDKAATVAPWIDGGEQGVEGDVENSRLILATRSGTVKPNAGAAVGSVVARVGSVVAEAEVARWIEIALSGFVPSAGVGGPFVDAPLVSPERCSEGGIQTAPTPAVVTVVTTPGTPPTVNAIGPPPVVGEAGKLGEKDEIDVLEDWGCPTVGAKQADTSAVAFTTTDGITTESKPVGATTAADYRLLQEGVGVHDASTEHAVDSGNKTLCAKLNGVNGSDSSTDAKDGPTALVIEPCQAPSTPKNWSGLSASTSRHAHSETHKNLDAIKANVSSGSVLSSRRETEERCWREDEHPMAEAGSPVDSGLSRRSAAYVRSAEEAYCALDIESSGSKVWGLRDFLL